MSRVLTLVLSLLVGASPALAQSGALSGVVMDASGAPVAGATISIEAGGK